ncbi:MAG: beta-ketoacyl synthase chain length factor [Colwellia sp.]|nr:beta-ketoacyl synthase chain length factor [Colwellia sp.]MCW8864256.1 beta-ketoacyl synthase chain length factor [Colwellia sp.]MCW9082395.1 beta-ketoacyl synthase chain length factor [Colwellia sp.]
MKVYINSINVWLQGLNDEATLISWANNHLPLPEVFALPKPQYYPKGQLRRLSPFSKVALHCLDMPQALTKNLPLVFASQHGDLAKTVKLIKDAALGEDLSPTQFALSVHNATTGLFSIATDNTAPTTTISAGKNTFIEGLVEAAMQCQHNDSSILYAYCDFDVPEEYHQFEARKPARCIAMVLSFKKESESLASINLALNNHDSTNKTFSLPDLTFIRNFYLQDKKLIQNQNYAVSLDFS